MSRLRLALTGDSFITQRLPQQSDRMAKLQAVFASADARFTNLETTIHNFNVHASAVSGGTWAAARPAVLTDLRWLGFNLITWANNHTLDYGHQGLLETYEHIENAGLVHAGVGRHLAEAAKPRYLDTVNGRVAIIGVNSTGHDWHVAGEQRPDMIGRPGVNPLRFDTIHKLSQDDLTTLKSIIAKTDVNAARRLNEEEGFSRAVEGLFRIDQLSFTVGDPGTVTRMHEEDARRLARSIHEAVRQADVVVVSHHAHEMKGTDKSKPADFIPQFARFCIDEGAHVYVGHGPHILRGIEIYRGCPIFYSLGNFIFQNDTVEKQPQEFYRKYGLGLECTPADAYDARESVGVRGLHTDPRVFESVIPLVQMEQGMAKSIQLYPVTLGFGLPRWQRGRPELAPSVQSRIILEQLEELSAGYGTVFRMEEGVGVIKL